jgi:Domain of unknown function (DUF4350)
VNDRLLTLGLAMGALAAFYVVLSPKPSMPQERVTRPLSTEAGPNGYLGLQRWLAQEGITVTSLRERYGSLAASAPGVPAGNLLITTAPHVYPMRSSEAEPLRSWIQAGNTMLILAGLSDTPEWSIGEGMDVALVERMKTMTGVSFTQIPVARPEQEDPEEDAAEAEDVERHDESSEQARQQTGAAQGAGESDDGANNENENSADSERNPADTRDALLALTRLSEPQRTQSSPNGEHPLLSGVTSILSVSEFPSARWQAVSDQGLLLELASDPESGTPALWLLPYGDGQIIVSAYGSLFTNKVIGEYDNARLLANVARWSLGERGRVIIDDAHQGLVSFYDPDKFFGDSRLHRSLLWLGALWLVFVLGPRQLRAAPSNWNPLDVTSFVRATGGFMARVLRPAAAGQRLLGNFFDEIRGRLGLAAEDAPVWEWLAGRTTIVPADLERLQELHRRVAERRRFDLAELHRLVARIRTQLN